MSFTSSVKIIHIKDININTYIPKKIQYVDLTEKDFCVRSTHYKCMKKDVIYRPLTLIAVFSPGLGKDSRRIFSSLKTEK